MPPMPAYLSHGEQAMRTVQKTLASRETLRMTVGDVSEAQLAKISHTVLSSTAREAFKTKEADDPLNVEKNR